jgi:hypothetical protein
MLQLRQMSPDFPCSRFTCLRHSKLCTSVLPPTEPDPITDTTVRYQTRSVELCLTFYKQQTKCKSGNKQMPIQIIKTIAILNIIHRPVLYLKLNSTL